MKVGKSTLFIILCGFTALILIMCPFVGQVSISINDLLGQLSSTTERQIFWSIRVPRVCLSFLAGAALAVSGMVFQAIFRNILADPFTLGVASGSAFGASLAYRLGLSVGLVWLSGTAMCSFLGALATMFLVVLIAAPSKGFSASGMLLGGVIVGFFFSSLILLMQYLSDFSQVFRITRWLMGSLDTVGFEPLYGVAPFIVLGILVVFFMGRELDLLALGDELAISRGLNVVRSRFMFFIATSLMVAGVVAVCGPIGFVGLVVPYVCRSLWGYSHRQITLCAILFGGAFLTLCDTVARTIIAPSELPVGVITALLGGPFFLWVLRRNSSSGIS